jgi:hypothetical protein
MLERKANYWHMLPELAVAQSGLVRGNPHTGRRRIDELSTGNHR